MCIIPLMPTLSICALCFSQCHTQSVIHTVSHTQCHAHRVMQPVSHKASHTQCHTQRHTHGVTHSVTHTQCHTYGVTHSQANMCIMCHVSHSANTHTHTDFASCVSDTHLCQTHARYSPLVIINSSNNRLVSLLFPTPHTSSSHTSSGGLPHAHPMCCVWRVWLQFHFPGCPHCLVCCVRGCSSTPRAAPIVAP